MDIFLEGQKKIQMDLDNNWPNKKIFQLTLRARVQA